MRNILKSTAAAVATVAALAGPAGANGGAGDITTASSSSQSTSKAEADAAAAAAARAAANNNNIVVVEPHNTANGGRGGDGIGIGHGGQGGNVGDVSTSVVNRTTFEDRLQAGVPPSIVVAPTSQCGTGFGFAAGFVGGSVGASFTDIDFRCVDTHAALTLFQAGTTIEERGVALATLANLSPAFDEAITSVAATSIRCEQEMRRTSSVLLAAGRCGAMLRND